MTVLSNPDKAKTRALREAVATYQDHIGNHRGAALVRAQPDNFTEWSGLAHQLVTVMDKVSLRGDLPEGVGAMLSYSRERAEAHAKSTRAVARLGEKVSPNKLGREQSENVIDRREGFPDPAPSWGRDILDRGERGFARIVEALLGDGETETGPRSTSDLARGIRRGYGSEVWTGVDPQTVDKHAWDAGGKPFGGAWYDRGEQLMREALAQANSKYQGRVGDDGGIDGPIYGNGEVTEVPGGLDFDGDGIPDIPTGDQPTPEIMQAAGGRKGKAKAKSKLWGKETKLLGVPTTPGSIVTAPEPMTIVYAKEFRSYKHSVIGRTEDGRHIDISGMTAGLVKAGDQIAAGQPIGIAGKTTNIGVKGTDGQWGDPTSLAEGLQSAGTDAVASTAWGSAPASSDYADPGLRGAPMMPGVAPSADYADAGLRGQPNPASLAKALSAPTTIDVSIVGDQQMGPASVPSVNPTGYTSTGTAPTAIDNYGLQDAWGDLKGLFGSTPTDTPAFERGAPPPSNPNDLSVAFGDAMSGLKSGFDSIFGSPTDEGTPAFERGFQQGMTPAAPSMAPPAAPAAPSLSISPEALGAALSDQEKADLMASIEAGGWDSLSDPNNAAAASAAAKGRAATKSLNAGLQGLASAASMGRKASALGDIAAKQGLVAGDLMGPISTPSISADFGPAPNVSSTLGKLPGPSWMGLSEAPNISTAQLGPVSTADSYGFAAGPEAAPAPASDVMSAYGSFSGIGDPDPNQAESFERGYQEGMAAALGAPPAPERKVDAFAPGLRGFKDAFTGSVKSVGPKAAKAFAAAFATPSLDNQMAAIDATRAYTSMNGQKNNPAVLGLRSQQIGDYAMANPAVAGALGLSMGQQGTGPLGGGLGSDPFGGGVFGGNGPVSSGAGGMGGMQGMGRASGPDGPGMGTMGGTIGGTSPSGGNMGMGGMGLGGAPGGYGGPLGGGTQGNVIGNGNQGMGGMSGMGGSSTGATLGRGPSSNPGSGGGLSASQAAAIGAALSGAADAAAAASSDAARGFGGYGGYGGFF